MKLPCFLLQRAAAALWPATLQIIGFVLQPLNHFLIPFFMASGVLVPRYSYVAQTCGAPPRRADYLTGYSLFHFSLWRALFCTYSMSNISLWPPAVIAAEPIKSLFASYV